MAEITLFHSPSACSRVTMTALEETGAPFSTVLANIRDEQKKKEYLAINPKGKVPALRVDGRLLTENAAILHHLHSHFPDARLLPNETRGLGYNDPMQDLVWCSATLHPMTRMIRAPSRFNTTGDTDGIRALGMTYYQPVLAQLAARFEAGPWWFGAEWSIIDVYLYWNYSSAQSGGLDISSYPALARHAEAVRGRPSFQRALARETADLEASGMRLPPGIK